MLSEPRFNLYRRFLNDDRDEMEKEANLIGRVTDSTWAEIKEEDWNVL